jgi:hypothetical protein
MERNTFLSLSQKLLGLGFLQSISPEITSVDKKMHFMASKLIPGKFYKKEVSHTFQPYFLEKKSCNSSDLKVIGIDRKWQTFILLSNLSWITPGAQTLRM